MFESNALINLLSLLGNCDIFVKQKISVIYEMKRDEILFKLKPRTFVEYRELSLKLWKKVVQLSVSVIFKCTNKSKQNSANIWLFFQVILTIFFLNLLDFYWI